MPLYEYQCQSCGKNFEELQSFKAKPLKKCKFCGGETQRVIGQTSFSLKGGGWYKDGYSNKKPAEVSSTASKDSSSANPGKQSESKKNAS